MNNLNKLARLRHLDLVYKHIKNDIMSSINDGSIIIDNSVTENKLSNNLKLRALNEYVTPEMFGAKGDGTTDDTESFKAALNDGRPVVGVGNYRITEKIFITHQLETNGESKIIMDFDDNYGIVIGGAQPTYDNTQYNFDVNITIDCNNRTFSAACVALNAIKRSHVTLRGSNCSGTFYKDVYGANGSNYENYIDINAIGNNEYGSVCAFLHSSDNNYNQIISRDFETCILMDSDSIQNINCIHGWLSTEKLWENSKLISVIKNGDTTVNPQLKFNFLYQDTMRYGCYVAENRIKAFGGIWFSAVNPDIISSQTISEVDGLPVISFYGEDTNAPSFIRADFHDFYSNRLSFNDKRVVIFNGEINPSRTGYKYSDANDIPMGNVTITLVANAANAPLSNTETDLVQFCSLRRVIQINIASNNKLYMRKKDTWLNDTEQNSNTLEEINNWSDWAEIGNRNAETPAYGELSSPYAIGSLNYCVRASNILEFAIDITIDSASVGTVVAVLPEGFHPLNNYQITCFGLTGNRYLDIYKTGTLVIQGSDISENTTLRIHSICIAK